MNRSTVLTLAAGVPAAVLLLAGCGGSSTPDTAAAAPAASPAAAGDGARAGRGPAASGEIAAVSGKTLQVQNTSAQTAVTWSASTKFTKSVPATLAAGDCVTVTGTPGTGSALTATSVRVVSTGGSCTAARPSRSPGAFPGGGGQRGGGTPPSGAPGGGARPSGAPGGGDRDIATAFGTVKSVSGSTVVLSGTLLSRDRFGGSPGATPSTTPAAPTASAVTVTLGSSVSVRASAAATGTDAKVGTCATATGKADSSGTVTATAIALGPKGADGCTATRGGLGGFGG